MARLLLNDLTPGTNYKIQLRAVEGDSTSEWSRMFDLTTSSDVTAPDVPTWAAVGPWVVNGDTFIATWQDLNFTLDQNVDFDHYELELDDNTKQVVIRTNNTSYTLTFDQNRVYFGTAKATVKARVRSVDAVGNASAWTSQLSATNPAPSAPASISVTSLMESIKVQWATVSDIDLIGYKVQVSTTSSSTGFSDVYNGPDNTFMHTTIMFNTDHWLRVYAVDKFGSLSSATTSGSVRPKSAFTIDTTPPATPASLTATGGFDAALQQSYFDLSWAAVADTDLDSYVIRYGNNGTNWQYINVPRELTAYRLYVDPAKSYYMAVTARDLSGNLQTTYRNASSYPVTSTADTTAPSQPAAPSVAVDTHKIQVVLSGLAQGGGAMEPDVAYYEVYAATTNFTSYTTANMIGTIQNGPAMVETFQIPASGASGTTQQWYCKVIAVDRAGNKSIASFQPGAFNVPLIATANIGDLQVTTAKINTLEAQKIVAGTGLINALTVKSTLTIGDASTTGAVQSYDYSAGVSGYKLGSIAGVTSLEINQGIIRASALVLQDSTNILPVQQADFESNIAFYNTNFANNCTINLETSSPRFGSQNIRITRGATTAGWIWYLAPTNLSYNMKVDAGEQFIVSYYVRNSTATTTNVWLGMKFNSGANQTDITRVPATSSSTWTRYSAVLTVPAGATDALAYVQSSTTTVGGTIEVDGIQIERKMTGATTPSAWKAPGSTTINGYQITTGAIRSSALAKDVDGNDIANVAAWMIDTSGNAVLGDILIRGRLVMGIDGDFENSISTATDADGNNYFYEDEAKMAGIGTMQSYNFEPGASGWSIRSNGFAEFLQLRAGSIQSDAIYALSPDKLNPGSVEADLLIGASIRSIEKDVLYVAQKSRTGTTCVLTLATSHARLIGDRIQVTLDTPDVSFDTPGKTFVTITAITDTTISYTTPSGSGTIGTTAATGTVYVEGRSVVMSPDGITLFNNDGISRIIDLPTDTLLPAYFAGDVEANSLSVKDDFLLQGSDNAIAAGGVFTLNAGVVAPSGTPSLSYNYDNVQTWMNDQYVVWRAGLFWDTTRFITTNAFYGTQIFGCTASGAFDFNLPIADDPAPNNDGNNPFGIVKVGTKYYVLTNDVTDGVWKIRRFAASGTGLDTLEATVVYDRHTTMGATTNEWKWVGWNGSALGDPIIGTDGTDLYIARCAKNGRIWVAKYLVSTFAYSSEVQTNITDNQNLKGLNVGTFDFAGPRYVISTEGTSSRTSKNYVTNASGVHQATETFPSPLGAKQSGMAWDGTRFVSLVNNRLFFYTALALSGSNVWYIKSSWADGTNSRTINITARSGNGTTTTLTFGSAHGFVAGNTIYVSGTGAGTNLDNLYFTVATAPTTTTLTFSSAYSGSGGAAGTATNEWESSLGNYAQASIVRRAKLTVSSGNIPIVPGNDAPDRARFYFSNVAGGAGSYYRQTNPLASNTQTFIISPVFSGSTSTQTPFPAGTGARFASSNGKMEIAAEGYALFGANQDASTSAGNRPALRVGDPAGNHLRMDGNEIISMTNDNTQGALFLNSDGTSVLANGTNGKMRVGLGGLISGIDHGSNNPTTNGSGDITISHSLGASPTTVIALASSNHTLIHTASTSTNFTLRARNATTGAVLGSGVTVQVLWMCMRG